MHHTRRLFDEDSYIQEFSATVTACTPHANGFAVVLDQTAFCPEGGGQKGDSGMLDDIRVYHTEEHDDIVHLTDKPLPVGKAVTGRIDWQPRWYRMQHHSGEHVLSGLVTQQYGLHNVGFHIGNELVTIDYDGVLSREQLNALEREANAVICQNRTVTAYYPTAKELSQLSYRSKKELSGAIRIVEIDGVDICACCAPHVSKTGEIGVLKITDFKHYKGGIRLQLRCGDAAVCDYQQKQALTTHIMNFLSSVPDKGVAAFDTYIDSVEAAAQQHKQETLALIHELASAYPITQEIPLLISSAHGEPARVLAESLAKRAQGIAVVLDGNDHDGYRYTVYTERTDFAAFTKAANHALNGKGGGKPPFAAGIYHTSLETIHDWFNAENK